MNMWKDNSAITFIDVVDGKLSTDFVRDDFHGV